VPVTPLYRRLFCPGRRRACAGCGKPLERQPLPERSREEASALERQIPREEQQQLQAGSDSFLALWKPANSAEAEGVVIIVPGAGENADWPQAIAPLRRKLPDAGWAPSVCHCRT